ncbi:MAG: AraC family transcriptional regulator [Leptolyngbya sp. SIOISBB]|nr:AraC family transcriptional regulator [Leptolyngbya sp. SIOISBB]
MSSKYVLILPAPALQNFVSHYWLSRDNSDRLHVALPDGAVDLVIQTDETTISSWLYGTTTTRTNISKGQNCHYLGIRFKPGQSRHFICPSAHDLTDTYTATHDALKFSINEVSETFFLESNAAVQLNTCLANHLNKYPPTDQRIDDVIRFIEATRGTTRMSEAAEVFGQSRRQFERVFRQTVGISAKTFAKIIRFHHAANLISQPSALPLAHIAAELNYTDQSHMNHDFQDLAGVSPTQLAGDSVAFLQDLRSE